MTKQYEEWTNVKDDLPEQFEVVWVYWKNQEIVLGCRCMEESYPNTGWYSFAHEKIRWADFWMRIKSLDKPSPPNI